MFKKAACTDFDIVLILSNQYKLFEPLRNSLTCKLSNYANLRSLIPEIVKPSIPRKIAAGAGVVVM